MDVAVLIYECVELTHEFLVRWGFGLGVVVEGDPPLLPELEDALVIGLREFGWADASLYGFDFYGGAVLVGAADEEDFLSFKP